MLQKYFPGGLRHLLLVSALVCACCAHAASLSAPSTLPLFGNSTPNRSPHVMRSWQIIGGVGVNVIRVNTQAHSVRVMPGFARNADPKRGYFPRDNFYQIMSRYQPRAAINGTYFHLQNGQPTGTIVRYSQYLYQGQYGTAICFDDNCNVEFRFRDGLKPFSFIGVRHAICTGPTLVRDRAVYLRAREEGFTDPGVLGTARRSAIGMTSANKLLLVTVHTPVTLNKLAHIMLRLGCCSAANLDGGASSGLYSNGMFVTIPGRKLSNVILVYD